MIDKDFEIPPELAVLPGKNSLEKIHSLYAPFDEIEIPIGVYKVFLDENENVIDVVYVYANTALSRMINRDLELIIGYSYLDTVKGATSKWFYYAFQSGCLGKVIQEKVYSPGMNRFLRFTAKRAFAPGFCIFMYTEAGEVPTVETSIRCAWKTDDLIITVSRMLRENHGTYETTLKYALREMGRMINPDRLYILELGNRTARCDFEWDAPGVSSRRDALKQLSYQDVRRHYGQLLLNKTLICLDNIEKLKERDEEKYLRLKQQGIRNLIAVPFYYCGQRQGFFIAENYEENEEINTRDLLETAAYFFAAEIQAGRLMEEMNYISQYDRLTNVHNRNAMEQRVDEFENSPEPVGIIYADINGLKQMNDRYGHDAGDLMIQQAVDLIKLSFDAEQIYRIGGDEFVVFVNACTEEKFYELVHEFRDNNRASNQLLSMGVEWIRDSQDIRACMKRVDTSMYEDKRLFYACHPRLGRNV